LRNRVEFPILREFPQGAEITEKAKAVMGRIEDAYQRLALEVCVGIYESLERTGRAGAARD
jgi:hypothetical protein